MTPLELLSPAKNLECGISAIDHGADAVYIGAQKFGARASAGNSTEDIKTLCQYAHRYGAKVYVTVNTIIYDEELKETIELIRQLTEIGADGILLQDMGLLKRIHELGIPCKIHASTQTDNRTAEKVRFLSSLGIKRVVLARELSINEISTIHEAVPETELEVFVHGALCVSYSGQCYASQKCFNRSANRGECAQFCRMKFDLLDGDGNVIEHQKHLLSLKDMAQIGNLERLAEAGAVSFKIEGRLKEADYVKNVTAAYSEKLNEICRKHPKKYRRASMGQCSYSFTPDIRKSFNRDFTTYFATGRQQGMANILSPKALGEPVGHVKELRHGRNGKGDSFNVASTAAFNNGDGLCYFNEEQELVGFRVNRAEGNRLFPIKMPEGLKPGTKLYRNHDQAFETVLAKPSAVRKIAVGMSLDITKECMTLTITDGRGHTGSATAEYDYQAAQNPQKENIQRQLLKLGGTSYSCSTVNINCKADIPFIPSSMLANLRRQAIEALLENAADSQFEDDNKHTDLQKAELKEKYPAPYLYNASNAEATAFYEALRVKASSFERGEEGEMLMQCRYCIRHEMGFCSKYTKSFPWKEPLSIRLADGKTFKLKFNCAKCQMEVLYTV